MNGRVDGGGKVQRSSVGQTAPDIRMTTLLLRSGARSTYNGKIKIPTSRAKTAREMGHPNLQAGSPRSEVRGSRSEAGSPKPKAGLESRKPELAQI